MKSYLTGCGEEYRVNWLQWHIGYRTIQLMAWIFKMNISIGDNNLCYGTKLKYEDSETLERERLASKIGESDAPLKIIYPRF